MTANESTGTFIAGFVIGGLIGTAIAQILAPQTGKHAVTTTQMPWHGLNKVRHTQRSVRDGSVNASLSSAR